MRDWQEKTLEEISESIDYGLTASAETAATNCRFLRITDIVNQLNWSNVPYVTASTTDEEKCKLNHGDIVIARTGATTGASFYIKNPPNAVFASYLVRYKIKPEHSSRYVSYFLKSHSWWSYIKGVLGDKSAQPNASASTMAQVRLPIPPLAEQKAIAVVLGALDDKIELNRRMNATLEAIARALFKSWFIDFGPVRAKMEGKQPFGMDTATAALFPSRLIPSPLGDIPEGWSTSNVGTEFDITMGQSPPGETYNESGEGLPFYQGRTDFGFRYPTRRIFCTQPNRVAEAGDTLISVRAPVGDINMAFEKCILGRGVGALRHKSKARSYTYYAIHSIQENIKAFEAEGTVFGSINKQDVEKLSIIKPTPEAIKEFEKVITSTDEKILSNIKEILELEKQRDYLLPKLISGDIRIPDAEKFVEGLL